MNGDWVDLTSWLDAAVGYDLKYLDCDLVECGAVAAALDSHRIAEKECSVENLTWAEQPEVVEHEQAHVGAYFAVLHLMLAVD